MKEKLVFLIFLFCFAIEYTYAARRVRVEDVIADTRMRFADEFKRRADDGNPLGLEDLLDLPKKEDLKPLTTVVTAKDVQKTKFEQEYENIPVYGSHITAAKDEKTGKSTEDVTGFMIKDIEEDIKSSKTKITKREALKIAKKYHKHSSTSKEKIDLRVYVKDNITHLAYFVKYLSVSKGKLTFPVTVVDANTKQVLNTWEGLKTAHKQLQGHGGNTFIGRFNFTGEAGQFARLNLTVDPNDDTRCLMENEYFRVVNLEGRHFDKDDDYVAFMDHVIDNLSTIAVPCVIEPIADNMLHDAYSVMNDLYYFAYHTFKMYESFNLTTYDMPMDMWVNFTESGGGSPFAFYKYIGFNNGGNTVYPMTSYPDVIAHEIGHSFTEINSALQYKFESGAMNEAFSDMSGETFDHYLYGQTNWIIGENAKRIGAQGNRDLRYMNNPPADGKSIDHYRNYANTIDVHYTSGIYNKVFHVLSTTNGWSVNKAFEVFSLANILYWGAQSTMNEGACGVIDAARDRGYSQNDVIQAFSVTGIACNRPAPLVVKP